MKKVRAKFPVREPTKKFSSLHVHSALEKRVQVLRRGMCLPSERNPKIPFIKNKIFLRSTFYETKNCFLETHNFYHWQMVRRAGMDGNVSVRSFHRSVSLMEQMPPTYNGTVLKHQSSIAFVFSSFALREMFKDRGVFHPCCVCICACVSSNILTMFDDEWFLKNLSSSHVSVAQQRAKIKNGSNNCLPKCLQKKGRSRKLFERSVAKWRVWESMEDLSDVK